jgi:hypothetical protein
MAVRICLRARDVTLLPETQPAPLPEAVPRREFALEVVGGEEGYRLEFDGRHATVSSDAMPKVFARVIDGTPVEWRDSSKPEIQAVFGPLNRIVQCLNTTPSYQLFLAGFHIGETIGMLPPSGVDAHAMVASFRYLVGPVVWSYGKKGRLFFLPEGAVTPEVGAELVANGKLLSVTITADGVEPAPQTDEKLFTPYATPIGFNTRVSAETEKAWRRIGELIRRLGGGSPS